MTSIASLHDLPNEFMVKLSDTMVVTLEGEQADSYLQGQITVNINKLDALSARHFAHCDNKGKTWSTGYVTRHQSKLLLVTNSDAGNHSLAQLNKYGVFSKVDILDDTPKYGAYFLSIEAVKNSGVKAALTALFSSEDVERLLTDNEADNDKLEKIESENGVAFLSNTTRQGLVVLLNDDSAHQFNEQAEVKSLPCYSHEVYNAVQIESVHAMVQGDAVAEYVPQMINVQALNGIDFDKGCYMGQEVVARTRFLGKNKRAAFSFKLDGNINVGSGDAIEKQLGENWRIAGKVLNVAKLESETWFIAVLSNDTTTEDLHRLADNTAITCYPNALPYSIEQQASNIVKKRR
ncbi:YgfZ/GcvT domain-containing protein [Alteromonas gracilis]|uniref:CAF17-like 4Fe-4S cluster assembly/insertion protein YgfZ n=1 Tax=Alteromonas gracilis TaxID=1479524 RepID=UPI0037362769